MSHCWDPPAAAAGGELESKQRLAVRIGLGSGLTKRTGRTNAAVRTLSAKHRIIEGKFARVQILRTICRRLEEVRVDDKNLHEFQHHPRSSCQRVDALIGLFPTGVTR